MTETRGLHGGTVCYQVSYPGSRIAIKQRDISCNLTHCLAKSGTNWWIKIPPALNGLIYLATTVDLGFWKGSQGKIRTRQYSCLAPTFFFSNVFIGVYKNRNQGNKEQRKPLSFLLWYQSTLISGKSYSDKWQFRANTIEPSTLCESKYKCVFRYPVSYKKSGRGEQRSGTRECITLKKKKHI